MTDVAKEIEEMETSLTAQANTLSYDVTDPPSTDQPVDDDATEMPLDEEIDDEESEEEEVEGTEEPKTEAPSTTPPVDPEVERIRTENEELRKRLDKLERGEPKTDAPSTEAPIEDVRFVEDDDEAYESTRTAEGLNALLNKVYRRGREEARESLREVPKLVKSQQDEERKMIERTNKFYEDNPDLEPWKVTVGAVFNELHLQNPNKSDAEIMEDLGDEVRKRIDVKARPVSDSATDDKGDDKDPPKLPKKRGQKRQEPAPKKSTMESEIDEMNKTLNM